MTDIKPKDVDGEPICSVSDCNCHRVIESGIYCTKGGGNGETRVIHRPNSLCIPGLRKQRDDLKKHCNESKGGLPDGYESWKEFGLYFIDLDTTKCEEYAQVMDERDKWKKECNDCGATFEEMMDKRGAQIEFMKCCGNCYITRDWYWTPDCYCHRGMRVITPRTVCPKWGFSKKKED